MLAYTLALFGLPGHWEAIIVILAILLLFGGKKLPELAKGLGRGLRHFKNELHGVKEDVEKLPEDVDDRSPQGQLPSHDSAAKQEEPAKRQDKT
jgi:sec-independent protein translocase protein TatA